MTRTAGEGPGVGPGGGGAVTLGDGTTIFGGGVVAGRSDETTAPVGIFAVVPVTAGAIMSRAWSSCFACTSVLGTMSGEHVAVNTVAEHARTTQPGYPGTSGGNVNAAT